MWIQAAIEHWRENPEETRAFAKDASHVALFCLAIVLVVVGGILTRPADLGLLAFAITLFGLVGIARA